MVDDEMLLTVRGVGHQHLTGINVSDRRRLKFPLLAQNIPKSGHHRTNPPTQSAATASSTRQNQLFVENSPNLAAHHAFTSRQTRKPP